MIWICYFFQLISCKQFYLFAFSSLFYALVYYAINILSFFLQEQMSLKFSSINGSSERVTLYQGLSINLDHLSITNVEKSNLGKSALHLLYTQCLFWQLISVSLDLFACFTYVIKFCCAPPRPAPLIFFFIFYLKVQRCLWNCFGPSPCPPPPQPKHT